MVQEDGCFSKMKSKQLRNIKEVSIKKRKKVLFINPKKKNTTFMWPHNGLATLAAILKKRGHEVLVADYAFMRKEQNTDISFFIKKFHPDIIGISIYTPNANEANELLSRLNQTNPGIPILVGGPHATLYTDILQKDKRIDYIFRGEAELTIIDVVETAKKQKIPKIIQSKEIVDLNDLPFPDYKTFYGWELIRGYPIMTSRGCPNLCSFCASFGLSYRRWRFRNTEDCIKELELAQKNISPYIHAFVMDDNPTVYKKRFHEFLDLFSKRIKTQVHIVNTRADGIDQKLLTLMKKCKCNGISIGVEHAHPEVFKLINKGETLEQIENACKLIKKNNMDLIVSFVIGLPGDNLERTKASIDFCKKVKADAYSINPIIPYRGTAARKWFEENNAKLYDEIGHDAQIPTDFECEEPLVETPDFSMQDRKKAYYMFLFRIAHQRLKLRRLPRIFAIAGKYNLYSDFFYWLPHGILKSLQTKKMLMKVALDVYRKEGFVQLVNRYKLRNNDI